MKNRFSIIFMLSGILVIATPLAQASVQSNPIEQGVNIVVTLVEWVVLIGLILSIFKSSWVAVNRQSNLKNTLFNVLMLPVSLGILAGGTAIITEKWTSLLVIDAWFALIQTIFFFLATVTSPRRN
jgi:ABC-type transport system involved in cytochrome c biogenesis permease component